MSSMIASRRASRDRWIPWAFVGFFATFITVDAVMVVLAVDSFSGVSTENAYQEGLAYNQALDQAAREKALGWTADVAFHPTGARRGSLAVTLLDRDGAPLSLADVKAELVRPIQDGFDFVVPLASDGQKFAAAIELPLSGQWEVRLVATQSDGSSLHRRQRIVVP